MHPKHYGLLCDSALEGLGLIVLWVEALGLFPRQIWDVLVQLFGKPSGIGLRPIGFFRSLFRLWGALKKPQLRNWELEHGIRGYFSAAPKTSPADAVWRLRI